MDARWSPMLAAMLAGVPLAAQDAGSFSVDVNLVVLHATVLNKSGGFVSGLKQDDFHVFEDGKPQTIRLFRHEDAPVAVGLLVDNSGSMRPKQQDVAAAAVAFLHASNPDDEMFVVNFNERVTLGLGSTRMFSANAVELEEALNGVPARGRTALYDAIWAGLKQVQKSPIQKKVLIVVSDGGDNASTHTMQEVLDAAERSDVIIYTIGLFDELDEDRNPGVLKKLARATGGECYLPREIHKVVEISQDIAHDIRNQYTIGYIPANDDFKSGFRKIQVTATGPHHVKCIVRTRSGYIATPDGRDQKTQEAKTP